jgi:hypothetical protein
MHKCIKNNGDYFEQTFISCLQFSDVSSRDQESGDLTKTLYMSHTGYYDDILCDSASLSTIIKKLYRIIWCLSFWFRASIHNAINRSECFKLNACRWDENPPIRNITAKLALIWEKYIFLVYQIITNVIKHEEHIDIQAAQISRAEFHLTQWKSDKEIVFVTIAEQNIIYPSLLY